MGACGSDRMTLLVHTPVSYLHRGNSFRKLHPAGLSPRDLILASLSLFSPMAGWWVLKPEEFGEAGRRTKGRKLCAYEENSFIFKDRIFGLAL